MISKIEKIHKKVNAEIYKKYPSLDMANLKKHSEGHLKLWEVEMVIRAYKGGGNEIQ